MSRKPWGRQASRGNTVWPYILQAVFGQRDENDKEMPIMSCETQQIQVPHDLFIVILFLINWHLSDVMDSYLNLIRLEALLFNNKLI